MANPGYVRSTDGSNADNGSTWALANADLAGAMADHAAAVLKPGGALIYATCSSEPEENDGVVAAFLAAHPD